MVTRQGRRSTPLRKIGAFSRADLPRLGLSRHELAKLIRAGQVVRIARGLYVPADVDATESQTLVEVCRLVPSGIVCLLSALAYHELGTQLPAEVWLAIGQKARAPRTGSLPVRIVRFSGRALTEGIEEHRIRDVQVRVTTPAKTVADCFKFRNKVGLDVALEALRDFRVRHRRSMDELWRQAEVCRVTRVMRPYLEALGA